jgi:hypothetical protein
MLTDSFQARRFSAFERTVRLALWSYEVEDSKLKGSAIWQVNVPLLMKVNQPGAACRRPLKRLQLEEAVSTFDNQILHGWKHAVRVDVDLTRSNYLTPSAA